MNAFHLLLAVVALTLTFEFSNGWHDAANSIATVVSTRVLTPFRAVLWAAFWNFVAAFIFGTAVAKTIGKGLVHIEMVDEKVLLAGLLGAIAWNLITLVLGLPAIPLTRSWAAMAARQSLKLVSARSFSVAGPHPCFSFFFLPSLVWW